MSVKSNVRTPDAPSDSGSAYLQRSCTSAAIALDQAYAIVPSDQIGYGWERVTEGADFPQMDGAGAVVHQDKMLVHRNALWLAAESESQPRNDVWCLRRAAC